MKNDDFDRGGSGKGADWETAFLPHDAAGCFFLSMARPAGRCFQAAERRCMPTPPRSGGPPDVEVMRRRHLQLAREHWYKSLGRIEGVRQHSCLSRPTICSVLRRFFIREPFPAPKGARGFSHKTWIKIWGGGHMRHLPQKESAKTAFAVFIRRFPCGFPWARLTVSRYLWHWKQRRSNQSGRPATCVP